MREKLAPVWLLAQRELRDQFRDWRILSPLLVLTFLFPPLMNFLLGRGMYFFTNSSQSFNFEILIPFSILIIGFFPVTVSLVIALESFVGEKERGTIEPLLGTPLLDWQLYLGKLLVGVFFPTLSSYGAIAFYIFMVQKQGMSLPPAEQTLQLLLLTFAHSIVMVSGAIVISTQSTSVRAANLLASFVIIPVAVLIQWESTLLLSGDVDVLWMALPAVFILATVLIRVGLAHFQREYLLGREIDSINIKWLGKTFWSAFRGDAHSLRKWYQFQVKDVILRLRVPIILVVLIAFISATAAYIWTSNIAPNYASEFTQEQIDSVINSIGMTGKLPSQDNGLSFEFVFWHNLRAVLLIFALGAISFGVLGEVVFIINIGVVGGLLAIVNFLGFSSIAIFGAGILPHGIFEIPALVLVSACVLRFGGTMITPDPTKTMGEMMIHILADWMKVLVGLVLPLLLIAALIETYITPHLLASVM